MSAWKFCTLAILLTPVHGKNKCAYSYNMTDGCSQDYGIVIEDVNDVETVIQCSAKCSSNLNCASARFDPHAKVCQINADTVDNVNTKCATKVSFVVLVKNSCRVLIGDLCSNPEECTVVNSTCKNGACFCKAGYSYNPVNDACVTECDTYGFSFSPDPGYVLDGYNNRVIENSDVESCKIQCIEEASFLCRTAEFYYRQNTCYLSSETKLKFPDKYMKISSYSTFQRDCAHNIY